MMTDSKKQHSNQIAMERTIATLKEHLSLIKICDNDRWKSLVKFIVTEYIRHPIAGFFTPLSLTAVRDILIEETIYRDYILDATDLVVSNLALIDCDLNALISCVLSPVIKTRGSQQNNYENKILGPEIASAVELPPDLIDFLSENQFLFVHYVILTNLFKFEIEEFVKLFQENS